MKRILIIFVFVFFVSATNPTYTPVKIRTLPIVMVDVVEETELIQSIIMVESSNNDSAYCASEDAVGCLQIRRVMVRDVNRILKSQGNESRYKMKDRWNRSKSIEIFDIYCEHYKLTTDEHKARCWNGGPKGNTKESTIKYWNKIKKLWTKTK